ncbi:hypothetical protein V6N13_124566 [Hibiscus sabdariffa]
MNNRRATAIVDTAVDGLSFFGLKSEYMVNESGNGRVYVWKKKGGELVRAMKEHVLGVDCFGSHPHTTVMASSGADDIKIWTPKAIDKAMLPPTKIEQNEHDKTYLWILFDFCCRNLSFINSNRSRYLDAISSSASQNCGMWMRFDSIDPEYMFFLSRNKLSAFLLPNVHSAIAGSANHIL